MERPPRCKVRIVDDNAEALAKFTAKTRCWSMACYKTRERKIRNFKNPVFVFQGILSEVGVTNAAEIHIPIDGVTAWRTNSWEQPICVVTETPQRKSIKRKSHPNDKWVHQIAWSAET